jgi:hypothetical protein
MKMDFLILDDIKNEIDKTDSNIQKKRNEVERKSSYDAIESMSF